MSETAIDRADQIVARRFSRVMNATTSPWGMLSDPPLVAVATAPLVVAMIAAMQLDAKPQVVTVLEVLAAAPLVIAAAIMVALVGARQRVVTWLAGLPFAVENMNALLNGLGDSLEIVFQEAGPEAPTLNRELERVSGESFVTKGLSEAGPNTIEVHIGVVDSKRNPSASNHLRFARVRALVDQVLVPLSVRYPIREVRVK